MLKILLILIFIFQVKLPARASHDLVDLHTHLFMKEGMGWFFHGGFNDPLKATDWSDKFFSQINEHSLNQSGLGLAVAALYAVEPFSSPKESIRRQVKMAREFVKNNPEWIIATRPEEARAARSQGKRILVLSLEGAHHFIEHINDVDELVNDLGIRLITFVHLIDNANGGAALMGGIKMFANPLGQLLSLNSHDHDGVKINRKGLTDEGRILLNRLIEKKVWIDLSHSSDKAQKEMIPILTKAGQPLLFTHISLRSHTGLERNLASWQIAEIKKHGGLVGLIPSYEMLDGTKVSSDICQGMCTKDDCGGGIAGLATQYKELADLIGKESVMIGSDFNGYIKHLPPTSCLTGTELDKVKGLWNIGQTQELWKALSKSGAGIQPRGAVERFIDLWSSVSRPAR